MAEHRLFISHASADQAVAERIVAYLEGRGVPCWISSRDIPPRAIYAEAITQGIQACGACVVIVSTAANASAAIKRELELASHYGKPFIPIRVDATEPGPGLDYYLRNTQWINYARDSDAALDRIAAQVTGAPTSRAAPPPTPARTPPLPPQPRKAAPVMLLAVVGIVVIAVGGWFAWSQLQRNATTHEVTSQEIPEAKGAAGITPEEARAELERRRATREAEVGERDEALLAARATEENLAREPRRREPTSPAQQEATEHNAVADAPQPPAQRGLIGSWSITIAWDRGRSSTGTGIFTFDANGVFDNDGAATGRWSQSASNVSWVVERRSYIDTQGRSMMRLRTEYTGRIEGETVSGTVRAENGLTGRFVMTRRELSTP
jgi:hypothetical protein